MTFEPVPIKSEISFSDIEKLDIRVGTIERIEHIEGADTLLRLVVNFGDHTRQILAGMRKERVNPREIEGRQALFVVNLPRKKMRGHVSEGMLFDIGYEDGVKPALAMPEHPVPNGTRAG